MFRLDACVFHPSKVVINVGLTRVISLLLSSAVPKLNPNDLN